MEHFGIKLAKRKYSFNLKRDEFALINTKPSLPKFDSLMKKNAYADNEGKIYREEWCKEYREICLLNYDLNMIFFNSLDYTEFNVEISYFLKKHSKFVEINSLFDYEGITGYYLMILDDYKQVYIGKSNNIKRRIQRHWSYEKPFDRILFPMYSVKKSCFSVDFFRALDTTRIFVWKSKLSNGIEGKLVADFPKKFCTNRIGGDITDGIGALATLNTRDL